MSYSDPHLGDNDTAFTPAKHATEVNFDTEFEILPKAIWVGTAGNIEVQTIDGATVSFSDVPVGFWPFRPKVITSNTTASGLIAVW